MLITVEEVIDALGGTSAAADKLRMSPNGISTWKARGKIPPDNFMLVAGLLNKRRLRASPSVFGFRERA